MTGLFWPTILVLRGVAGWSDETMVIPEPGMVLFRFILDWAPSLLADEMMLEFIFVMGWNMVKISGRFTINKIFLYFFVGL